VCQKYSMEMLILSITDKCKKRKIIRKSQKP